MAIRYRVKVINNPSGLPIRRNPNNNGTQVGMLENGKEVIINATKTSLDSSVWFRLEDSLNWILYQNKGLINLKLMQDVSSELPSTSHEETYNSSSNSITKPKYDTPNIETGRVPETGSDSSISTYVPGLSEEPIPTGSTNDALGDLASYYSQLEQGIKKGYTIDSSIRPFDVLQQNEASYPPVFTKDNNSEYIYDYTVNTNFLKSSVEQVKRNLNVPSAYDRNELNLLMNKSFNRYNITYPDYLPYGLMGVVFFTRPDIWVTDESGAFIDQVNSDPQLFYISKTNEMVLKQLTLGYTGKHEFIPLLCNTCRSLDVGDESVETMDIGETFSGYKMQYARHSIRSLVSGTFNCRFQESYDLSVTHMMQAWCSYESAVYLGTMLPKTEYIGQKILDYACDAYLFLVDRTNTIKYFTKYYGVFPINVNKSIYSFDSGSPLHMPEQNITFAYFHRKDLSPDIIVEFNNHSKLPLNYKLDYESKLGHSGTTWSGAPFVEVQHISNGTLSGSDQLILRYRTE